MIHDAGMSAFFSCSLFERPMPAKSGKATPKKAKQCTSLLPSGRRCRRTTHHPSGRCSSHLRPGGPPQATTRSLRSLRGGGGAPRRPAGKGGTTKSVVHYAYPYPYHHPYLGHDLYAKGLRDGSALRRGDGGRNNSTQVGGKEVETQTGTVLGTVLGTPPRRTKPSKKRKADEAPLEALEARDDQYPDVWEPEPSAPPLALAEQRATSKRGKHTGKGKVAKRRS